MCCTQPTGQSCVSCGIHALRLWSKYVALQFARVIPMALLSSGSAGNARTGSGSRDHRLGISALSDTAAESFPRIFRPSLSSAPVSTSPTVPKTLFRVTHSVRLISLIDLSLRATQQMQITPRLHT